MTREHDETTALFDAWAPSYDHDLEGTAGPLLGYLASLEAAAGALHASASGQLLDVGVGTGALAALLERPELRVAGVDPSPVMLEHCATKHPTWELRTGSTTRIPFPAASFDVVASAFAWHETVARERPQALQEIARVLRVDGTLAILDIMFASEAARLDARKAIANRWDESEEYALVGSTDDLLRFNGFRVRQWAQTGPYHWLVLATRTDRTSP